MNIYHISPSSWRISSQHCKEGLLGIHIMKIMFDCDRANAESVQAQRFLQDQNGTFVNISVIFDPFHRFTPQNESQKMQKKSNSDFWILSRHNDLYSETNGTLIKEICRNYKGLTHMYNSLMSYHSTVIRLK